MPTHPMVTNCTVTFPTSSTPIASTHLPHRAVQLPEQQSCGQLLPKVPTPFTGNGHPHPPLIVLAPDTRESGTPPSEMPSPKISPSEILPAEMSAPEMLARKAKPVPAILLPEMYTPKTPTFVAASKIPALETPAHEKSTPKSHYIQTPPSETLMPDIVVLETSLTPPTPPAAANEHDPLLYVPDGASTPESSDLPEDSADPEPEHDDPEGLGEKLPSADKSEHCMTDDDEDEDITPIREWSAMIPPPWTATEDATLMESIKNLGAHIDWDHIVGNLARRGFCRTISACKRRQYHLLSLKRVPTKRAPPQSSSNRSRLSSLRNRTVRAVRAARTTRNVKRISNRARITRSSNVTRMTTTTNGHTESATDDSNGNIQMADHDSHDDAFMKCNDELLHIGQSSDVKREMQHAGRVKQEHTDPLPNFKLLKRRETKNRPPISGKAWDPEEEKTLIEILYRTTASSSWRQVIQKMGARGYIRSDKAYKVRYHRLKERGVIPSNFYPFGGRRWSKSRGKRTSVSANVVPEILGSDKSLSDKSVFEKAVSESSPACSMEHVKNEDIQPDEELAKDPVIYTDYADDADDRAYLDEEMMDATRLRRSRIADLDRRFRMVDLLAAEQSVDLALTNDSNVATMADSDEDDDDDENSAGFLHWLDESERQKVVDIVTELTTDGVCNWQVISFELAAQGFYASPVEWEERLRCAFEIPTYRFYDTMSDTGDSCLSDVSRPSSPLGQIVM